MAGKISKRLEVIINSLPLEEGLRILEIGCGTGVAAREIAKRISDVYVLGIDRSAKAVQTAVAGSQPELSAGKLRFQKVAVEDFLFTGKPLFDLAFAIRVGALDGRHPDLAETALLNIAKALKANGKLFIDGGDSVKELDIRKYR